MLAIYVSSGDSIPYTPDADVTAGDVVILNNFFCVAPRDIAAGELGSLTVDGIHRFPKGQAEFAQGDPAYWHITSQKMVAADDESSESEDQRVFAGLVTEDAADSDTAVNVRVKNDYDGG